MLTDDELLHLFLTVEFENPGDLGSLKRHVVAFARAIEAAHNAVTPNQCDGCNVDAPLTERGNHAMPDGGVMACVKDRYEQASSVVTLPAASTNECRLPEVIGADHIAWRRSCIEAYVEGFNACRAAMAAPQPAVAKEGMTEEQRGAIETALSLIGLSGDPRVRNVHKVLRALLGAKGK